MHKLKVFILFSISIVFLLTPNFSAFAQEKVTLSTYYHAPIAEYCDLEAEKSFIVGEENTTSDFFTNITPFYGDVSILPQNRDVWAGLEGGSVGIGTDTPTAGTKLEVVGGIIKATGGLIIQTITDAPAAPVAGQLWLRTDIKESYADGDDGGSLVWTVTSNPSSNDDWAFSITSDTDYLYITGWDFSLSTANAQWRIEKRSKSNGGLLWVKTSNPSFSNDVAHSTISDGNYLYIAGSDYSTGNGQWRVEKRSKSDGGLIWAKTSNTSSGWDMAWSITSDNDYLYIAGHDYSSPPFNPQWRIEKRSKFNGSLLWAKTNDPSSFWDYAYSIISDTDYLYIAGVDQSPGTPGDSQWRIEKRSKFNGSLLWTKTSNPNAYNDTAFSIAFDTDYLYITGCNAISAGDYQWRIEKRSKSDGSLIWAKTSNPSSGVDYAKSIASDTYYLYITGWDDSPGDSQWRIEKRSKFNGSLLWTKTSNPSSAPGSGYECAQSITSDTDYLYIAGYDLSPGDRQWRIEKRSKSSSTYADIGLRAYDGTETITIACEPETAVSSALRIGKDSKVYGVILVDITDPDATSIRIRTSSGVKALRKFD
jgi:hypothetical protein